MREGATGKSRSLLGTGPVARVTPVTRRRGAAPYRGSMKGSWLSWQPPLGWDRVIGGLVVPNYPTPVPRREHH